MRAILPACVPLMSAIQHAFASLGHTHCPSDSRPGRLLATQLVTTLQQGSCITLLARESVSLRCCNFRHCAQQSHVHVHPHVHTNSCSSGQQTVHAAHQVVKLLVAAAACQLCQCSVKVARYRTAGAAACQPCCLYACCCIAVRRVEQLAVHI